MSIYQTSFWCLKCNNVYIVTKLFLFSMKNDLMSVWNTDGITESENKPLSPHYKHYGCNVYFIQYIYMYIHKVYDF